MLFKTKALVLRTVKYGETSVIVTMFTELFGVQSYLVNGIRQASKKGSSKAGMFQPGALLELEAYHNNLKNLQRIKEFRWAHLFTHLLTEVRKNSVALFMIELLTKCLKQPEPNPDLFYFTEDALIHLDGAEEKVTANFPIYFALHLAVFFGFRISDESIENSLFLDLQEGSFTNEQPPHNYYLNEKEAKAVSHILKVLHPSDLQEVVMNVETRRRITAALEEYYALHIPEFGTMRTLPVLREVMS